MENKLLMWIQDNTQVWITPGGDPVWCCQICGGDRQVMGIESTENQHNICKDCGAVMEGYDYGR